MAKVPRVQHFTTLLRQSRRRLHRLHRRLHRLHRRLRLRHLRPPLRHLRLRHHRRLLLHHHLQDARLDWAGVAFIVKILDVGGR